MAEKRIRIISGLAGISQIGIGLAILHPETQMAQSLSWQVMASMTPLGVWPVAFMISGLLSFIGAIKSKVAILSFYVIAGLMVMWAVASAVAAILYPDSTWASAIFLFYIALLHFVLADLGHKIIQINKITPQLEELHRKIVANGSGE